MKHVGIEHEVQYKVGNHLDPFIVTADCLPTDEKDVYDIKITVKSKKRNRRKIHKGQIELPNPETALEDVKAYMDCGDVVNGMLDQLSLIMLIDYPEFYPPI